MVPNLKLPPFINHLKVRRHAQARCLKLHIDPLHKIPVLTVPKRCSKTRMEAFLYESREWLEKNYQPLTLPETQQLPATLTLKDTLYQLDYMEQTKAEVSEIPESRRLIIKSNPAIHKIVLLRYLKDAALKEAIQLIQGYAQLLNVKVRKVGVKEYTARWGCCYKRGDIFVSWRLILAPYEVFKYVCAHEVTHLVHHDHSARFWNLLETISPTYKDEAKWLKEQGRSLFSII